MKSVESDKSNKYSINIDGANLPIHILGAWVLPLILLLFGLHLLALYMAIAAMYLSIWLLLHFAVRWLQRPDA